MPPIDNSKTFKNYHQELFCINGLGVKIITVSCENYLSNFREFYLLNILVSLSRKDVDKKEKARVKTKTSIQRWPRPFYGLKSIAGTVLAKFGGKHSCSV